MKKLDNTYTMVLELQMYLMYTTVQMYTTYLQLFYSALFVLLHNYKNDGYQRLYPIGNVNKMLLFFIAEIGLMKWIAYYE